MDLAKIMRYGSSANVMFKVGDLLYKQFYKNEDEANKKYRAIYPSLRLFYLKYGRESQEFKDLLDVFSSLAPCGIKRKNFITKYVSDEYGWRFLPKDPNDIMFGYWW